MITIVNYAQIFANGAIPLQAVQFRCKRCDFVHGLRCYDFFKPVLSFSTFRGEFLDKRVFANFAKRCLISKKPTIPLPFTCNNRGKPSKTEKFQNSREISTLKPHLDDISV